MPSMKKIHMMALNRETLCGRAPCVATHLEEQVDCGHCHSHMRAADQRRSRVGAIRMSTLWLVQPLVGLICMLIFI